MDSRQGDRIFDSNMDLASVGGGKPSLVPGKIGASLQLSGRRRDFVDLGPHGDGSSCLGNLSVCIHGLTVAMWIRFDALRDDMHVLSTGVEGIQLYYRCALSSYVLVTTAQFDFHLTSIRRPFDSHSPTCQRSLRSQ